MIEHEVNNLNLFIMGWYGDPSIADDLIEKYDQSEKVAAYMFDPDGNKVIDKNIKDSADVYLGPDYLDNTVYGNHLRSCVDLYYEKFSSSKISIIYPIEGFNIQKYPIGGGFKLWHSERMQMKFPEIARHFVFMTYLNDVPDGGTEFLHQTIKIKAEKGLTLIWPADWTYTHRGEISYTTEKIIATGWLHLMETHKHENSTVL